MTHSARRPRMTSDQFIAWAMEQPEGERYELVDGEIVAMAPERAGHALTKHRICRRLEDAVAESGLDCEVYPDGMAVLIDGRTTYEPDAQLRCGPRLPADETRVTDPLIVVEVLSPSTGSVDAGLKVDGYFGVASVRHYLIIAFARRTVIHHERTADGAILTHIIRNGDPVRLDPPGIVLSGYFPDFTTEPEMA